MEYLITIELFYFYPLPIDWILFEFHYKQNDVDVDDAVEEYSWTEHIFGSNFSFGCRLKISLCMSHVKPDDDYNNNVHDGEKDGGKIIKI